MSIARDSSSIQSHSWVSSIATGSVLIIACLAGTSVHADPPTLPEVEVIGQRVGGGVTIVCRGMACGAVLGALVGTQTYEHLDQMPPILEEGYDSGFCTAMNNAKPDECPQQGPGPIAPMWSWNWTPSTCIGANAWLSTAIAVTVSGMPGYSYNINEPVTGYNFQAACEELSECWGVGFGQSSCSYEFSEQLGDVCGSNTTCQNFANVYSAATGSTLGNEAYDAAYAAAECAAWHYAMDENSCPQVD